jgi:hypothetical protein
MKSLLRIGLFMLGVFLMSNTAFGQDKSKRASPPMEVKANVGDALVAVNYSAPSAKGRAIWGELVPYGKVWRAGANEATTFESDKDLMVAGEALPAGKYSVFLIPNEGEWTFIFNSISDQWGAYQYDDKKDVLRVTAVPSKTESNAELLEYKIQDGKLWLLWADQMAGVSLN